jgi:hypothetical protein
MVLEMPKETTINLNLRLPPELHRQLIDSAAARHPRPNSLNSEIIERLRYTFKTAYQPTEPIQLEELQERLAELERAIWGEKADDTV